MLEYYLSEVNKGDSTPQITFEVLLKLLEEKYPTTKGRFKQKYLEELALQETNIPKNDEALIRKVLSEILAESDIIGGEEQHKKDLRQKEEQEISPWLYCKFYKDRHLKRIKMYVSELFYYLVHSLRSETNQPVHQDIIPQRSYTKRNRSDIVTEEKKPLEVSVNKKPKKLVALKPENLVALKAIKPVTTKNESKMPKGRPGKGTFYYLARKQLCEKGGIRNKDCYGKEFRATKTKFCKLVQIAAGNSAIFERVNIKQLDKEKDELGEVDELGVVGELGKVDEQKERMKHTINVIRKAITDERIKNQCSTTLPSQRNLLDTTTSTQVSHILNCGNSNASSRQSIRELIGSNAQCGSSGNDDQDYSTSNYMSDARRESVQNLRIHGSLFGSCGEHVSTGRDEDTMDFSVTSSDFDALGDALGDSNSDVEKYDNLNSDFDDDGNLNSDVDDDGNLNSDVDKDVEN